MTIDKVSRSELGWYADRAPTTAVATAVLTPDDHVRYRRYHGAILDDPFAAGPQASLEEHCRIVAAPPLPPRLHTWYSDAIVIDQVNRPLTCAAAWWHWLRCKPDCVRYPVDPVSLLRDAYAIDGLGPVPPENSYRGTTLSAVGRAVQRRGYVSELYYSRNVEEVWSHLTTTGPVVCVAPWSVVWDRKSVKLRTLGTDACISAFVVCQWGRTSIGAEVKDTRYVGILASLGLRWGLQGRKRMALSLLAELFEHGGYAMTGSDKTSGARARRRAVPGVWPTFATALAAMPEIETVRLTPAQRKRLGLSVEPMQTDADKEP